jgi:hypothetical protein
MAAIVGVTGTGGGRPHESSLGRIADPASGFSTTIPQAVQPPPF